MTRYPHGSDWQRLKHAGLHLGCAVRHQWLCVRETWAAILTIFNLR